MGSTQRGSCADVIISMLQNLRMYMHTYVCLMFSVLVDYLMHVHFVYPIIPILSLFAIFLF